MEIPLQELAKAAIYIDELARGVTGGFIIEENGWNEGDTQRTVAEVHSCQRVLIENGWRRNPSLEREVPVNHRLVEVAVYEKRINGKRHLVTIQLTSRFGIHASFTGERVR